MPDTSAPAYDVFISYSHKDKAWVHDTLLPRLEAHGLRVCIDFRDFRPGVPSADEMERAVLTSRYTLIVLTSHYLKSNWSKFERLLRQTLDADTGEYRLIPLLKEPCTLPISISYLTHVDFTDPAKHAFAWNKLLDALKPPSAHMPDGDPATIPAPAPLPPRSRMPLSRNPLFVGREDDLRMLWRVLKTGETAAIGQIAAATGLGGIGKTQLACEFVHRYGQRFPGSVFWLSFADPNAVPAEVAACGGTDGMQLRADFGTLPLDEQVQLVLAEWKSVTARLLVFDNCEDETLLDKWRPKYGGCSVLVTSRRAQWDHILGVHALRLEVLPRAESLALLRKFRPDLPADDPDLNAIAEALGDLPLALHLAGSFLAKYRHAVTPAAYLQRLSKPTILDDRSLQSAGLSPTKHVQHVARTFEQSYERLDADDAIDALALKLIARAAYFAPGEPLPRWLLIETLDLSDDDPDAALQVEDALTRLIDLGLLENESEGWLRLHRLLAAFVRAIPTDDVAQTTVEDTMLGVANRLNEEGDPRPLLAIHPHLRAIADAAHQREDERAAGLCTSMGYYLKMIGDYAGAREYLEQALAFVERTVGQEHLATGTSLNNLGYVLQVQGDYAGAQKYFERALVIVRRTLGIEHFETAVTMNNLGYVLQAQGDYAGARMYLEQALVILERELGVDDPITTYNLNNLGILLEAQGNLTGARRYHERVLSIRERIFGVEHLNTARSLNNLGSVLRAQGNLTGAQAYYERALVIKERVLGMEHPDTATTMNNLGHLLQVQGDYVSARVYLEQALTIRERILGMEHPDTAQSLNNMGGLLQVQRDYAGARKYYERTLAIYEQVLGPAHPDMAQSLYNLGGVLFAQWDYRGARRYFERALAIWEQCIGPDHPKTRLVRNDLAQLNALLQTPSSRSQKSSGGRKQRSRKR